MSHDRKIRRSSSFEEVFAHAKQQAHSNEEFLSNNGGEFDNLRVKRILPKNGITQRLIAPNTPEIMMMKIMWMFFLKQRELS